MLDRENIRLECLRLAVSSLWRSTAFAVSAGGGGGGDAVPSTTAVFERANAFFAFVNGSADPSQRLDDLRKAG
jgi:hypothetical protein